VDRDGRRGLFLTLMDATGHGVPGAFTAMLMTSFLGHALDLVDPWEPERVLAAVNRRVKEELGQGQRLDGQAAEDAQRPAADEGMDATCLWLDADGPEVRFAGARHSLWVFAPGAAEPEEVRGDKAGVGYTETADDQAWTRQTLSFAPGTVLVATTDGIVDQIGGPKHIAFGKRRLWEAFQSGPLKQPLRQRLERCQEALAAYQGGEPRRDDISLLALQR
jgi:serine phosphatase RsbU (regulator of sigma subunit)